MSFRRPAVLIAVAVTMHCGGNSSGGAEAGFDATPVDAALVDTAPVDAALVDAAPDAPPEPEPPCTGTLTFTQQAPLPGWSPFSLVAADINSDMHVDALVGTLGG